MGKVPHAASLVLAALALAGAAPAEFTTDDAQRKESTLGNLVADALRSVGKANLALVTAVSLADEATLAPDADADAVRAALRYPGDRVLVVQLTGQQIRAALEWGLSQLPRPHKGFLQVSGLTVVYDSRQPRTERVVSVKVGRDDIVPDRRYRVAMPSSLARGRLGYFTVWGQPAAEDMAVTLRDAVVTYLKAAAPRPRLQGRLRDAGQAD